MPSSGARRLAGQSYWTGRPAADGRRAGDSARSALSFSLHPRRFPLSPMCKEKEPARGTSLSFFSHSQIHSQSSLRRFVYTPTTLCLASIVRQARAVRSDSRRAVFFFPRARLCIGRQIRRRRARVRCLIRLYER